MNIRIPTLLILLALSFCAGYSWNWSLKDYRYEDESSRIFRDNINKEIETINQKIDAIDSLLKKRRK